MTRTTDTTADAQLEETGEAYSEAGMLETRDRTRAAVYEIAEAIEPGMTEREAVALAKDMLKERGLRRGWHGVFVRIGPNTLNTSADPPNPDVVLHDTDIFFVDIGPVWQEWEGDFGDTFVVGDDPEHARAQRDLQTIFDRVADKWRTDGSNGRELYRYAHAEAEALGWQLNQSMRGHRISEFPHAAHYNGGLADVSISPSTGLWVLEIQIRHPERPFGAFIEDLLLADRPVGRDKAAQ